MNKNELTIIQDNEMLATMDNMLKFSETVCKSGLCPAGLDTKEKVFVAVQWGKELNLSPMVAINNIAVVNGKPSLSTDIMQAIARQTPGYNGIQWIQKDDKKAVCVISRKFGGYGSEEQFRGEYSIEDAQRADLLKKDNWKKYPARMLAKRALSYALKDAFPDALAGIYSQEEATEIAEDDENIKVITPPELHDDFDDPIPSKTTEKDFE